MVRFLIKKYKIIGWDIAILKKKKKKNISNKNRLWCYKINDFKLNVRAFK